MNLERIIKWEVNGTHIEEAKKAVEQLPEGVLGNEPIIIEKAPKENKTFYLKLNGKHYHLQLPGGLSNIGIYRTNNEKDKDHNGKVTFDCGEYHYILPGLKELDS